MEGVLRINKFFALKPKPQAFLFIPVSSKISPDKNYGKTITSYSLRSMLDFLGS